MTHQQMYNIWSILMRREKKRYISTEGQASLHLHRLQACDSIYMRASSTSLPSRPPHRAISIFFPKFPPFSLQWKRAEEENPHHTQIDVFLFKKD